MTFLSDNTSAVHPDILKSIILEGDVKRRPYGTDDVTKSLNDEYSELFQCPAWVIPCVTGTAANCIALALAVRPFGATIVHETSHVFTDESTAPEMFTGGARTLTCGGEHGKVSLDGLKELLVAKGDVHAPQPQAMSICQCTEAGTVYSDLELRALGSFASDNGISLHVDGARLANGLVAAKQTAANLANDSGAFAITFGGTKNGCLGAEALVLFSEHQAEEAKFHLKRTGHLLSKMKYISTQLSAYIKDDLWLKNAARANESASQLLSTFTDNGISVAYSPDANIIFANLSQRQCDLLRQNGLDGYQVGDGPMRFVCSWDTSKEDVRRLANVLDKR